MLIVILLVLILMSWGGAGTAPVGYYRNSYGGLGFLLLILLILLVLHIIPSTF